MLPNHRSSNKTLTRWNCNFRTKVLNAWTDRVIVTKVACAIILGWFVAWILIVADRSVPLYQLVQGDCLSKVDEDNGWQEDRENQLHNSNECTVS